MWNRTDHRPLEGFVYAITPFNFTAIAGNLPTAPALMGNTVIWKPSPTQQFAAHLTMELLEEAGLPPGRDQHAPRRRHRGLRRGAAPPRPGRHPLHRLDPDLPEAVGHGRGEPVAYRSYPRIVGETGGKDFIVAHPSADVDVLRVAMIRGAFEFQGQKCSAASRAYVPASVWKKLKDQLVAETENLTMGNVTDLSNFMGAVIDDRAFAKHKKAIARAKRSAKLDIVAGGSSTTRSATSCGRRSWSPPTRPTRCSGRVLRPDPVGARLRRRRFETVVDQMESFAPYALTGAVIAQDREAVA